MLIWAVVVTAAALIFAGLFWLERRSFDALDEKCGILEDENESIRAELKATEADLAAEKELGELLIAEFALAAVAAGFTAEENEEGGLRLVPQPKTARKKRAAKKA